MAHCHCSTPSERHLLKQMLTLPVHCVRHMTVPLCRLVLGTRISALRDHSIVAQIARCVRRPLCLGDGAAAGLLLFPRLLVCCLARRALFSPPLVRTNLQTPTYFIMRCSVSPSNRPRLCRISAQILVPRNAEQSMPAYRPFSRARGAGTGITSCVVRHCANTALVSGTLQTRASGV